MDREIRDEHGRRNATRLADAIGTLQRAVGRGKPGEFWQEVKQVAALFKDLKPLAQDDRQRLWAEFGRVCDEARSSQDRRRDERQNASRQKRSLVENKLSDAYHQAKGARSTAELKVASRLLAEAQSWMRPGWSQVGLLSDLLHLSDGRLTTADHDACWTRCKEVRETIDWRWKEFSAEWEAKQRDERSRRVARVDKARAVIRHLYDLIERDRERQHSARSSDFASVVQGWIDDKESKIRDIEESVRRDEDVIADIDRRLSKGR